MIDERAIINQNAKIAEDATIEPFAVIGAEVEIGAGTWIGPHVVIKGPTRIGRNNKIYQFASIGEDPQDISYHGEKTYLEIGDNNIIREFCTINRGTAKENGKTIIGNNNFIMSYAHIAHDCIIGNHTILANNATLAGHVHVEDYAVLSGFAVIYQFCHLGAHCFLAGGSLVMKDVLPFTKVAGDDIYAKSFGLNNVGLRRRGFTAETRALLKRAHKIITREGLTLTEAIAKLRPMVQECPEIQAFIDMLETTKHGIVR
ncbi:MAG: acyl-ACP--UDP-N-acetylglucosamine O-acyltransferase [Gammaproteobacteria bacterium]